MPRKGKRKTLARGIYGDSSGFEIRVTVNGQTTPRRFPPGMTLDELKRERRAFQSELDTDGTRPVRGTLLADTPRYLNLVRHLASWKERRAHLGHWNTRIGPMPRHQITAAHILSARVDWRAADVAPKTINHRVDTLRHLYRTLDGRKRKTPCDDVVPLHVPKTPIQRITNETILKVDANLQEMEARRTGPPWDAKTRARFRVFVSTGKRPCEIMRAVESDVNLDQRVWVPRDAKGGFCPGVYLNDDQLAAWRLFFKAEAWGRYSTGQFANTIRSAGWPKGVRPYQARHTTWITASELGIDLTDIAAGAGHKDLAMTRKVYVPVLNSRLQRMSEALDGRFQGWPVVPESGPARNPQEDK